MLSLSLALSLIAAGPDLPAQSASSSSGPACPAASRTEIDAQFSRFDAALAAADPDAVTALFTSDPVLLPTLSDRPRRTPDEVRAYFVDFLKLRPRGRVDSGVTEIDCRTASRVGTWTVSLTDPTTGAVREVAARYTFLYRFEGGEWRIDHLHSSLTPPGP